jgi:hypothetical protein
LALDETTILAIVTTLIIVAAGLAGSVIVAGLTESLRSKNEKRADHLRELKSKVLQPVIQQVDKHYLPILKFRNSNLSVNLVPNKKIAAKLTEQPVDYRLEVVVWNPGITPGLVSEDPDEKSGFALDSGLLADCREHHFQKLMTTWNDLQRAMKKYNEDCLSFSDKITEEIRTKLGLPKANTWNQPGEYVTPALGFEVFQRMVGLGFIQFSTDVQAMGYGNVLNVRMGGSKVAQLRGDAPPDQIENAIGESIEIHREEAKGIVERAGSLVPKFEQFAKEMVEQLETQKLPGKCSYV